MTMPQRLGPSSANTRSAILDLVLKLSAAGHRRIGFLSWTYPVGGHWVARRFSGYVEALFYQGLEFRPEWVINVHKQSAPLSPSQVADVVDRHSPGSPRALGPLLRYVIPSAIAISRIYRGQHHVSDTVAGIALGRWSAAVIRRNLLS